MIHVLLSICVVKSYCKSHDHQADVMVFLHLRCVETTIDTESEYWTTKQAQKKGKWVQLMIVRCKYEFPNNVIATFHLLMM